MNYAVAAHQLRSMRHEREHMRGDWLCAAMDRFVASSRMEFIVPDGHYRINRPIPMKAGCLFGPKAHIRAIAPSESCFSIAHENANGHIDLRVPLSCDDHPSFIAAVIVCPPKLIGSCFHAAKNEHEQQSEVQYPERAA